MFEGFLNELARVVTYIYPDDVVKKSIEPNVIQLKAMMDRMESIIGKMGFFGWLLYPGRKARLEKALKAAWRERYLELIG